MRQEALLACSDVGELAARAAAAQEHAARFEKIGEARSAGGEPEPEPEPEPEDSARKGIQDQLDAEYGEQQAGVAASKSAAMARMETRQREREAERNTHPLYSTPPLLARRANGAWLGGRSGAVGGAAGAGGVAHGVARC